MARIFSFPFIILVLALSGCAKLPVPPPPPSMSWEARQLQLTTLKQWDIRGKIGIRHGNQGENANLTWKQNKGNYTIELQGPLNMHRLLIQGKPGTVSIESSDGEKRTGVSPEYIMHEELGWTLPFGALLFWVRGLPIPDIPTTAETFTASQQLSSFKQGDWQVEFLSYQSFGNYSLPEKIKIQSHVLSVKLILRKWLI